MHSAFNLLVFPNSMFTPLLWFFYWKGYVLSGEIALKNNHYYYYYYRRAVCSTQGQDLQSNYIFYLSAKKN